MSPKLGIEESGDYEKTLAALPTGRVTTSSRSSKLEIAQPGAIFIRAHHLFHQFLEPVRRGLLEPCGRHLSYKPGAAIFGTQLVECYQGAAHSECCGKKIECYGHGRSGTAPNKRGVWPITSARTRDESLMGYPSIHPSLH
ncbi:hypothetical protein PGTUg99_033666 [Puccinia graminis f. sp. tritici]|uniref:Uncharacterized protein n=1 Tax=Puccinia graminis f. sp. tritici TaxID=56615 RepID=A0A5B0MIP4_PUCGR|nr:hypothetical protein PGTUg99_033666 [Puccinia graminis f. sp. tritici]